MRLAEAAAPGGRKCGPCPNFASYTLAFVLQLKNITENLSQANWNALGWSAPNAIHLVELAIAGDGLDGPASPCCPWLRVGRRGQPSVSVSMCQVAVLGDFPGQLTFSQSSQSGFSCGRETAEHQDPRVFACYLRIRGTSNKAKTLGL